MKNEINLQWSFFSNLENFFQETPKTSLISYRTNENCNFADNIFWWKNIYLSFSCWENAENILYSYWVYDNVVNVCNSVSICSNSQNIYCSTDCLNSTNIFFSKFINNCHELRFCSDTTWCNNCIMCDNIENQSYCINNKKLSKEDYEKEKKEILSKKEMFLFWYKNIKAEWKSYNTDNCTGKRIINCSNIENWLIVSNSTIGRNDFMLSWIDNCSYSYDCFQAGHNTQYMYAVANVWTFSEHLYCSVWIDDRCSHIYYSFLLRSCSYCIWCYWLQNKSFCILNKQYTKEERYELANKIFEKMDQDWSLWKFFPPSMNPFYFNDTVAYLIDDTFTKEEVTKEGYLWREEKIAVDIPKNLEIIYTGKKDENDEKGKKGKVLSDFQWFDTNWNRQIDPEILKKVIVDEQGNYYTIQKLELEFLQKYGLPLPEIHWLERIKLGFRFK